MQSVYKSGVSEKPLVNKAKLRTTARTATRYSKVFSRFTLAEMSNKEHEGSFSIKSVFGKKQRSTDKVHRKDQTKDSEEKYRSKSLDMLDEIESPNPHCESRRVTLDTLGDIESSNPYCESRRVKWPELSLLKTMAPVVLCVLPSSAQDLVGSALLAVGASPVFPEGEQV